MDKYKIPNVKTFEYTKIVGIENIEFGKNIIIFKKFTIFIDHDSL